MNLLLLQPEDFVGEPLREGDVVRGQVRIAGERGKHLSSVLRAAPGDPLQVGLVNGPLGTGTVSNRENREFQLEVVLDRSPPSPSKVRLVLALPRPKVLGRVLKTVSALGVKDLTLVGAQRVEKSYWQNHRLEPEVLAEFCRLGLEQAVDTTLPEVRVRQRLAKFALEELANLSSGTERLIAHPGAPTLQQLASPGEPAGITLAIGPEGGWLPLELELFQRLGFQTVGLGDRILHIEAVLPWMLGLLENRLGAITS